MKIIRELGMGCFFSFSLDGTGLGVCDSEYEGDGDLLERDCDLLESTGVFSGKFNVPFLAANCIFFC